MSPRLFVVLTTQRSGSSWIVDLVDSHPAVACYAELFRVADRTVADYGAQRVPRFTLTLEPDGDATALRLLPRRVAYLRRMRRAHRDVEALGFKLMYDQIPGHPGLLTALVAAGARFVHVVRRDRVAGAVSYAVARKTGRWRLHRGEPIADERVRVEPGDVLRLLEAREREVQRWRRRVARLPVRSHELVYEDVLARPQELLRGLLVFLGVSPDVALASTLVPTREQPLDRLVNADEILAALAGQRGRR